MRLLALALILATVVATGCGGDESESEQRAKTDSDAPTNDAPIGGAVTTDGDGTAGDGEAEADGDVAAGDRADDEAPEDAEGERPPSRTEYIKQADAICRRAQEAAGVQGRKIQDAARALQRKKLTNLQYYRRTGTFTRNTARIAARALDELESLPPPSSRRQALAAYFAGTAERARLIADQAEHQYEGEPQAVMELNARLDRTGAKTRKAARRFGFHVCGA